MTISTSAKQSEQLNYLDSEVLTGGAAGSAATNGRRKAKSSSELQSSVLLRILIKGLKSCLNNGSSLDSVVNLLQQSQREKPKKKKKKLLEQVISKPKQQTKIWNGKPYTIDDNGWWSWVTEKSNQPAAPASAQKSKRQPVREHTWISGVRVEDWDTVAAPKVTSSARLKDSLRKGEPLPGNVCEVWTVRDLEELQALWQSFDDPGPLTAVLFGEAQTHQGILFTRLLVHRGSWGPKIENVGLCQISTQRAPWIPQLRTLKEQDIPKIERTTIRVCAPKLFRGPFIPDSVSHDNPTVIIQNLAHLSSGRVSDFFGGRWSHEQKGSMEQTIGFLRVKPNLATKLIEGSGKSGLFISAVGGPVVSASQPFWIQRQEGEGDDSYLQRVLKLKDSRKQPTIFRLGKGDSLGFARKADDVVLPRKRLMCIHGIPGAWRLDEVACVLTSQEWFVENLNKKGRAWFFMGLPPKDDSKQTYWRYNMGKNKRDEDWCIEVQVASRPQKAPNHQELKDPSVASFRKFGDFLLHTKVDPSNKPPTKGTGKGQAAAASAAHVEAQSGVVDADMEHKEVARPTSQDSRERSPRRQLQQGSGTEGGVETQAAGSPAREPVAKRLKFNSPKSFYPPTDPDDAVAKGWEWIDLAGNGDCFYRCFAYHLSKTPEPLTQQQAAKEASFVRVKMVEHIRKYKSKFVPLFETEDDFKTWTQNCLKTSTWANSKAIQAVAGRYSRVIVVWSCTDNVWLTVAPKFSNGLACFASGFAPVTLILKDRHYQVLKPPAQGKCPNSWLRETPNVVVDLCGAGKTCRPQSCRSSVKSPVLSVHTLGQPSHRPRSQSVGPRFSRGSSSQAASLHTLGNAPSKSASVLPRSVPPKSRSPTPSAHTLGKTKAKAPTKVANLTSHKATARTAKPLPVWDGAGSSTDRRAPDQVASLHPVNKLIQDIQEFSSEDWTARALSEPRLAWQNLMLACNQLSRLCNNALEDLDSQSHPPRPSRVTTSAATRQTLRLGRTIFNSSGSLELRFGKRLRVKAKLYRSALMTDPELGPFVKDTVDILGCSFSPGHSKPASKEIKRFEVATAVTRRAGMAPVAADFKLFAACATATTKASFGWVLRAPTKALSDKLETKLRSIGWNHRQAAPALVQLLAGHSSDVQFTSGFNCVAGLFRFHRLRQQATDGWDLRGGFADRCRKFLRKLGWEEVGWWQWQLSSLRLSLIPDHQDFPGDAKLLGHILRESWRRQKWLNFLASGRLETGPLAHADFSPGRIAAVRTVITQYPWRLDGDMVVRLAASTVRA
eukprot:Skav231790  [mRNA]  locus=scaffold734:6871:14739:+ [translate_table: standard]